MDQLIVHKQKKIRIRQVKSIRDMEYLRPVSVEFHAESRWSDIAYSHKKAEDFFMKAINKPKAYGLIVAERDGEPMGFIFSTVGEFFVGYSDLITTVYFFFVRRKFRGTLAGGKAALRLLSGVVKWSQARNVHEVMIHVTSGIDIQRTDRFLRRAKFGVIGANYALRLAPAKAIGRVQ